MGGVRYGCDIMDVILLPGNFARNWSCGECLNLLFALFLLHFGMSLAIAFLIFMLVSQAAWHAAISANSFSISRALERAFKN